MAYDEELAEHIRLQLAGRTDVFEKRMFGGIGFMVGGHLAIAASSNGGALVRVGPDEAKQLIAREQAGEATMGRRTMRGWVRVASADLHTARQLQTWLDRSFAFLATLPDKAPPR